MFVGRAACRVLGEPPWVPGAPPRSKAAFGALAEALARRIPRPGAGGAAGGGPCGAGPGCPRPSRRRPRDGAWWYAGTGLRTPVVPAGREPAVGREGSGVSEPCGGRSPSSVPRAVLPAQVRVAPGRLALPCGAQSMDSRACGRNPWARVHAAPEPLGSRACDTNEHERMGSRACGTNPWARVRVAAEPLGSHPCGARTIGPVSKRDGPGSAAPAPIPSRRPAVTPGSRRPHPGAAGAGGDAIAPGPAVAVSEHRLAP